MCSVELDGNGGNVNPIGTNTSGSSVMTRHRSCA